MNTLFKFSIVILLAVWLTAGAFNFGRYVGMSEMGEMVLPSLEKCVGLR